MAHLELSLLGAFQATLDEATITAFESGRVRALLAYLAVEADRPHTREALAALLWPERTEREAHDNLRAALANLRTALQDRQAQPPFLLINRATLQFNPAADYRLDVQEFGALLSSIQAGEGEPRQPTIRDLQTAVELYRGPFLRGFTVGSVEFQAWQLLQQEQLECRFLAALQQLAALHEARGEYEPAMACARRHLESVPWDEPAHRRLMRLLALVGRRGAALTQYEACRKVLAAEFGAEPSPDTTALYERIRAGKLAQPAGADRVGPASPAHAHAPWPESAAPFVARERELAALDGYLARALAGRGGVVLVSGEAGSGKTALLAEFARRAAGAHLDLVVAGGSGNEHLGLGDPYLPFRQILQQLTGEVEGQRSGRAIPGEQADRLWALLPAAVQALLAEGPDLVDRLLPGAALALRAEAYAPGGAAWRTRLETLLREREERLPLVPAALHEQVARVLQAIARRQPLLLLLDDLQWADSHSLSLLYFLGRRLAQAGGRLLVIGAYRPYDLLPGPDGAPHPLPALLSELRRDFGEMEVDLEQAAGRAFVDAVLDAEPNALGEPFRESLSRATGGHALFTVELLREMRERGSLVRDEAGRWVEGPALDWDRLPARVEAVIAGRLDERRLPVSGLALLRAASVEGEVFAAEVLAHALGVDEAQVLDELNGPLSRGHLVHARGVTRLENGRRLSHYQFRHALFQTFLYRGLNAVERARLHEAVGMALERLHGQGAAGVAAQLARHFEAAGLADRAADYMLLAGRQAYWLSAPDEAIRLYRGALALLETQPDGLERARRELDLQLALNTALLCVSDRGAPDQVAALARASALSERLGEPERRLLVLSALMRLSVVQGQVRQAVALALQLLSRAQDAQDPVSIAEGHHLLGFSSLFAGDLAVAREHLERALALYRRYPALPAAGPPGLEIGADAEILTSLALILWLLGYPDQALARNREGLALGRELPHTPSPAMALSDNDVALHVLSRRLPEVRDCVERLQRLVTEKKLEGFRSWVSFYQGWLLAQADPERGLARMRASMPSIQVARPHRLVLLAGACLLAGQIKAGQEALDEALALVEQTGARSIEAEMHRLRGELLLRDKAGARSEEAEACFHTAIDIARRQGAKAWELRAATSLARLWAAQGRVEEARAALAGVYGWFTEGFDSPDLVEARELLAGLAR